MRKIAIELEVNGVKESVNTIGELETAIEQLTEELKNTEIGSENFTKLSNELNGAKSQLKTFEQAFEGLDPQQKTQAYLAFGESVVSGILLAQEALRTFGIENEDVNNAVEKSTQAINLALQARIVVEGVLEARVLATTLAQRALNTSIVAGNGALRLLFTTIAANPVGALLTAIGLLVTAFIALSDSSEESTDNLEDNEAAQKSLELQSKRLKRELTELNDATSEYIDNLDNVDLSTAVSESARLEQELSDLKDTAEEVRDLDFLSIAQDLVRGDADLTDFNLSLAEQKILFDTLIEATDRYEGALRNAQGTNAETLQQNLKDIERVSNELQEQIERTEGNTESLEKKLNAVNKRIKDLRAEISKRELDKFSRQLGDAAEQVDRLNRRLLEFGETPTPKIIDDLEKLVQQQIRLQEITDESRKTLGDAFNDYVDGVVNALKTNDDFGESYEKTRKDLTDAFRTGEIETFQTAIDKVYETYFDENSNFNDEQRRTISQLLSGYQVAFQQLQQFGIDSSEEFETIVSPLLDSLAEKLRLEGSVRFDRAETEENARSAGVIFRDAVNEATKTIEGTPDITDNQLSKLIDSFTLYEKKIDEIVLSELSLEQVLEGSEEFYNLRNDLITTFTEEFLKSADLQKLAEEDRASAQQEALKRAQETADGIIEIITNTAIAEDSIRGVYNEVEDLQGAIQNNTQNVDTFLGLIIENFDEIGKQIKLEELLDPSAALEDNFQQIVSFFESIGVNSVDILFRTEEEKLAIVDLFLKKRQELLEENADAEKETQEDLLDTTLTNYQEIVNGLNQLTLSLGEASQLQIERIENAREQSLSNIVGDTKEAEELRAEITEQSNREIVEIERRARLRELQFTKIQAIADLAQALVNAQKLPPPFNAIQSGIVSTAGGIQVAVIQSQIDDLKGAQGFKTGGFVSGQGTGTSDSIPAFLSNGEFVVNAKATKQFLPLLEQINNEEQQIRRFANGGFVLDSSTIPSTNIQNIFDDSRIIEELRKTRQEPLRAYVFEKDITEAQQVEKRLQELSKL